jgi:predicted dehydrogenase/threonine dehydrogenase-like Zn-dependent dehydrogenase
MKKIVQNIKSGQTQLLEMPVPSISKGKILIRTTRTLVSLGTERMLVGFAKSNLISKARQQPEKVKMVLDKIKSDGLIPTLKSVNNKFNEPMSLGYCNVGIVVDVSDDVTDIRPGDRVVSNGAHAEFVSVSKNLVHKIPDEVEDEDAVFTILGAIGLQGVRLCNPTFGETIVVYGLGLIGLITIQLLKANGCNVIGIDLDQSKVDLANSFGVSAINPSQGIDEVNYILESTNGVGCDGVIITASANTDAIIANSAQMCRKRGRVVLVGVIGLNIARSDFYEKEISFQVSCSYGPGRYEDNYEEKGLDYPIGFVRWTEKRNFGAILNALKSKQLNIKPLITERVKFKDFDKIYANISNSNSIASILLYDKDVMIERSVEITKKSFTSKKGIIGIIGSGGFTSSTILPILKKINANVKYLASSNGFSSSHLANKFGVSISTTNHNDLLDDSELDLVFITTRHNSHGKFILEAIDNNKSVFVEKPLTINNEEFLDICKKYEESNINITLGFNRRFAPLTKKMKTLLGSSNVPLNIIATMNAGAIPADSWVHDMSIGGGRILGEACHFIDLCSHLASSKVISVCMNAMGISPKENTDNASIMLKYKNGSTAVINYFANGSKAYSKERIEVYSQERTLVMDNWRKLKAYGFKGFSKSSSSQDKGHYNQFINLIHQQKNGGDPIIPFDSIVNTTKASFAAIKSLKEGIWISIK